MIWSFKGSRRCKTNLSRSLKRLLLLGFVFFTESLYADFLFREGKREHSSYKWSRVIGGELRQYIWINEISVGQFQKDNATIICKTHFFNPSEPMQFYTSESVFDRKGDSLTLKSSAMSHREEKVTIFAFIQAIDQPFLEWFSAFEAPQQLSLPYQNIINSEGLLTLVRQMVATSMKHWEGYLMNTIGLPQNLTNHPEYISIHVEEAFFKLRDVQTKKVVAESKGKKAEFYVTDSGNFLVLKAQLFDQSFLDYLLPTQTSESLD